MKRLITFLLATCVLISACGLFACDGVETPPPAHEHSFSQQWTKDDNYHWHDCQAVDCDEKADKQAHEWTGEGTLTCTVCGATKQDPQTPPVHEHSYGKEWTTDQENHWKKCSGCEETAELGAHEWTGEGTLTCTVCGATKVEEGGNDFSGEVDKEQWDLAVAIEKFDNVTIKYSLIDPYFGLTENVWKIAGDRVQKESTNPSMLMPLEGELALQQKQYVLSMFQVFLVDFENFTFDAENGVYIAPNEVTVTNYEPISGYTIKDAMKDGKVKFTKDGLIEWFACDLTESVWENDQYRGGQTFEDTIMYFSDYGTTEVDPVPVVPNIPQNTYTQVTEEQWKKSMSIEYDCEIDQVLTMMLGESVYYVMEDMFVRSGNVIKFADWYIVIDGETYYEYYQGEDGNWKKQETSEETYIRNATFRELISEFNNVTFDSQTGLYVCEELNIENGEYKYYNIKAGFVDGKLAYLYYEEEPSNDGMKPTYQCYFEYKTVEVTLPKV